MPKTKIDEELAAAAEAHADDPERARLLERARQFKASWIELAEALTAARRDASWKRWGYDSFDAYALKELHLRGETAEKLTGSYAFLQKRAPEVLRRDGLREPIPSYQSIDFLRRAEERDDAPRDVVTALRGRVLDEAAPLKAVSKQFKEVVFPLDEGGKKKRDAAALKNVGQRLRELLTETRVVPRPLAREVGEALDRLLAALPEAGEEAA
jgi:hypothetical protein